jgi:hypothetical protein
MSLGVTSFITGKKAPEHFKSIGFTKLLLLSRDDFLKVICYLNIVKIDYPGFPRGL